MVENDGMMHSTSMFLQPIACLISLIREFWNVVLTHQHGCLISVPSAPPWVNTAIAGSQPWWWQPSALGVATAREASLRVKSWPTAITHQTSVPLALTLYPSLTWCQKRHGLQISACITAGQAVPHKHSDSEFYVMTMWQVCQANANCCLHSSFFLYLPSSIVLSKRTEVTKPLK